VSDAVDSGLLIHPRECVDVDHAAVLESGGAAPAVRIAVVVVLCASEASAKKGASEASGKGELALEAGVVVRVMGSGRKRTISWKARYPWHVAAHAAALCEPSHSFPASWHS
jgi:hypothetical protein